MPFARFQVLMHVASTLVPNKQPIPMTNKTDVAAIQDALMRLAIPVAPLRNVFRLQKMMRNGQAAGTAT